MRMHVFFTVASFGPMLCSASIEDGDLIQPDSMNPYYSYTKNCDWKVTEKQHFDSCPGDRRECILPLMTANGKGYISIVRYGPYTSRGGYQETNCFGSGHIPELGEWIVAGIMGPVDAYTGHYMDFPPIHNHHTIPRTTAFDPLFPNDLVERMPFLSFAKDAFNTFGFPGGAADSQCTPEMGGTGCFYHAYPAGYGKRTYRADQEAQYVYHVQDVREKDSPPLSYFVETAEYFITEINPQAPLKPVFDMTMGIFTGRPPFTYDLQYDTPMYNFVSYYFPVKAQLVGIHMHWHPISGDEAWLVRGTQQDMGIPKRLQWRTITSGIGVPNNPPVPLGKGEGEMSQLKERFEDSITQASFNYFSREQEDGSDKPSLRSRRTSAEEESDALRYVELSESEKFRRAPQILCKYYAQTERITKEHIQQQDRKERDRLGLGRSLYGAEGKVEHQTKPPHEPSSSVRPTLELVPERDHVRNKFIGAQPGEYYRASTYSLKQGENRYPHCNEIDVEAGEVITLIHFMEPRRRPTDPNEFDSTPLTMSQHTAMTMHVHIPRLPFM